MSDAPQDEEEAKQGAQASLPTLLGMPLLSFNATAKPLETSIEQTTNRVFGAVGDFVGRFSPGAGRAVRNAGTAMMKMEHSVIAHVGEFNVERAVACLDGNATSYSRGICARNVREAVMAGGIDLSGHPIAAADYKGFMETKGFGVVAEGNGLNTGTYVPQAGDICVWGRTAGHEYGHIAMLDNNGRWVSDFMQRDMAGGEAFRAGDRFTVYRHKGDPSIASNAKPAPTAVGPHAPVLSSVASHIPSLSFPTA